MKSDKHIQQDVLDELSWEPSVHAGAIGVEVADGVVTLAGHVGSYAEKYDAERAAQRVSGVRALAIEMEVKLPALSKRTDADIAGSAESALHWTTFMIKDRVKVMVEGGWITLTGEVDWEYQRASANLAVRYLMGVTGVSNQILIKPKVSVSAIQEDIEAALKRRANDDAGKIGVLVNGHDVTLSGSVHSWSERELAADSAWAAPGVYSVRNNIEVAY